VRLHLESQNFAGWLDGAAGVVCPEAAGVSIHDPTIKGAVTSAHGVMRKTFRLLLGRRSYVGGVTEADIDAASRPRSGGTMAGGLREVGMPARAPRQGRTGDIGYIEAHIEQGRTLRAAIRIGVRHLAVVSGTIRITLRRTKSRGHQAWTSHGCGWRWQVLR